MAAAETMGVRTAAQRLGCTLKYVYDLLYSGRLPARKIARQWRIPAAAVEARLRARKASDANTTRR
jgi:excisionase family DNA binding protein